jgi:DNA ligase D-like protein (predicted ligase)
MKSKDIFMSSSRFGHLGAYKAQLKKEPMPSMISPMLATLTDNYFSRENWIYERKLDGERIIAYIHNGNVILKTRNNIDATITYPEITKALKAHAPKNCVLDGEVVAYKNNLTSFEKLQKRIHLTDPQDIQHSDVRVYYYIFDIVYLNTYNIMDVPLRKRKVLLKDALNFNSPLKYVTHINEYGIKALNEACEKGQEGIIAKKAMGTYLQKRSRDWLKFKCVHQQELIIIGYTDPEGERIFFGALLLGYYKHNTLQYAGKVGTGFDEETLKNLYKKMHNLIRKTSPLPDEQSTQIDESAHWVNPELVCEVGFAEWTKHNKLRHPRYLGLRRDKSAQNVFKEEPT